VLGVAEIEIAVPVSYQPVSPLIGGEVLVDALPAEAGDAANATWNWTIASTLRVCAELMVTEEVV